MKLKTISILLLLALQMLAQSVKITGPIAKLETGYEKYQSARFSPDGRSIAASGVDFNGLYLLDISGKKIRQLSDASGIGWNYSWSPSGTSVAGRVNQWDKSLKTSKIVLLDLNGNILSESESSHGLGLPYWSISGGTLAYFDDAKGWQTIQAGKSAEAVVAIGDGKLHVIAGVKSACDNFAGIAFPGQILNIAWSPSGARACVEVAGKGLYVYECANNAVYDLGYGEFPCWFDDEYFTYSVSRDDGYKMISSDIYIKKYNGNDETNLTRNFNEMAMYPSCSRGGDILFTTDRGEMYKMNVSISR